jgi:hypothetical protein
MYPTRAVQRHRSAPLLGGAYEHVRRQFSAPFCMPNDVGAAILDPHEPQSLTPVANKFSCQSFSVIVHGEAKAGH